MGYPSESGETSCEESVSALLKGGRGSPVSLGSEKSKPEKKKAHECDFPGCGQAFYRPWRLKRHVMLHSGERPIKCDVEGCKKAFRCTTDLGKHKKQSHSDGQYKKLIRCTHPACSMMLSSMQSYQRHYQRIHSDECEFKCSTCNMGFKKRRQLKAHRFAHTGVAELKCDTCNLHFGTEYLMKKHLRSHREYVCDFDDCGKVFGRWTLLLKHKREDHPVVKEFCCAVCERKFRFKTQMKIHLASHQESDERTVERCPVEGCPRFYYYKSNLKQHILSYHEGKRHQCSHPGCGRSLVSKQKLIEHMRIHDPNHSQKKKTDSKKPRRKRKDAGIPKPQQSMAGKLAGLGLSLKMEKEVMDSSLAKLNDEDDGSGRSSVGDDTEGEDRAGSSISGNGCRFVVDKKEMEKTANKKSVVGKVTTDKAAQPRERPSRQRRCETPSFEHQGVAKKAATPATAIYQEKAVPSPCGEQKVLRILLERCGKRKCGEQDKLLSEKSKKRKLETVEAHVSETVTDPGDCVFSGGLESTSTSETAVTAESSANASINVDSGDGGGKATKLKPCVLKNARLQLKKIEYGFKDRKPLETKKVCLDNNEDAIKMEQSSLQSGECHKKSNDPGVVADNTSAVGDFGEDLQNNKMGSVVSTRTPDVEDKGTKQTEKSKKPEAAVTSFPSSVAKPPCEEMGSVTTQAPGSEDMRCPQKVAEPQDPGGECRVTASDGSVPRTSGSARVTLCSKSVCVLGAEHSENSPVNTKQENISSLLPANETNGSISFTQRQYGPYGSDIGDVISKKLDARVTLVPQRHDSQHVGGSHKDIDKVDHNEESASGIEGTELGRSEPCFVGTSGTSTRKDYSQCDGDTVDINVKKIGARVTLHPKSHDTCCTVESCKDMSHEKLDDTYGSQTSEGNRSDQSVIYTGTVCARQNDGQCDSDSVVNISSKKIAARVTLHPPLCDSGPQKEKQMDEKGTCHQDPAVEQVTNETTECTIQRQPLSATKDPIEVCIESTSHLSGQVSASGLNIEQERRRVVTEGEESGRCAERKQEVTSDVLQRLKDADSVAQNMPVKYWLSLMLRAIKRVHKDGDHPTR